MAALMQGSSEDQRRAGISPRPKGRENAKDTLCRNVTIYGHCRYEDKGCAFNHDPVKAQQPPSQTENIKKRFNVDSPSFTPSSLAVNGNHTISKTPGLSPKIADAAPFKPRNLTPAPSAAPSSVSSSSLKQYNPNAPDWIAPENQEFLPQTYNAAHKKTTEEKETKLDVQREASYWERIQTWVPGPEAAGSSGIEAAKPHDYQTVTDLADDIVIQEKTPPKTFHQDQTIFHFSGQSPENSGDEKRVVPDNAKTAIQSEAPRENVGKRSRDGASTVLELRPANRHRTFRYPRSNNRPSEEEVSPRAATAPKPVDNATHNQSNENAPNSPPARPTTVVAPSSMEEREKSTDAKAQSLDTTPPTMLSFRPFEDHFKVFEEHLAATQATFPSLTPRRSNPGQEICNPSLQTSGAGTPYPLSLTPFTPIGTNRGSVSNFNVSKSCPSYALRRPTMPGGRLDPAIMDDTASSNSKGSLSYPLPTARTSYMPQRSSLEETRDASSSSKVQAVGLGLVLGWSITESSSRSPKYDSVSGKPGIEQHSTADRSSPFTPSKKRRSKRSMRLSGGAHASTPKPRMPSTPINPHNYGHSQQLRAESSYLVPARGGPGATKGRLWISGRPPYPSPSQYTPQGQNFIFDIRPSNTGSPPIIPDHMTHMFGNGFTPYGGFSGLRNSRPNTIPTPQPMVRVGNFMMPRAEYQRLFAELRCFRCGQHGHVARFCPDENSPLKHFNSNDSPPFAPHHSQNNSVAMDAYKYSQNDPNSEYPQSNSFDPYAAPTPAASTPNHTEAQHIANPYPLDTNGYSQTYFPSAPSHSQFLQHHLYAPLEAQQKLSKPNQRTAKDLFIPEDLRRKLQAKTDASLKTFPNSALPQRVDFFHTLTPLQGTSPSTLSLRHARTVYKAISAQDGRTYCLKRFHSFEVTSENEHAVRSIRARWSPVVNSNVVSVHYAFTTTEFHDTSLIIVSDYHPASYTVADKPSSNTFPRPTRNSNSQQAPDPLETVMWNYVVQIANGLKAIHPAGLAARSIDINKVLVTDGNRIRLNGCAIEDLFDKQALNVEELQRKDFYDVGKFVLAVGAKHVGHSNSRVRAPDPFQKCSERLRSVIKWLLDHIKEENNQGIDVLLDWISPNITDAFDASLRLDDELQSSLMRELENSRVVRLMTKLNCLNERPEHEHDRSWSPQGPRAVIPLFRDYVFHQVDAQGNPVVDMGHILACVNKLDVGLEEKIQLMTRDESNIIIVSYKEVKAEIDRAWQELMRRSTN